MTIKFIALFFCWRRKIYWNITDLRVTLFMTQYINIKFQSKYLQNYYDDYLSWRWKKSQRSRKMWEFPLEMFHFPCHSQGSCVRVMKVCRQNNFISYCPLFSSHASLKQCGRIFEHFRDIKIKILNRIYSIMSLEEVWIAIFSTK